MPVILPYNERTPEHTQIWTSTPNITSANSGGYQAQKREIWWKIKNALISGSAHPWTVTGSASPTWPSTPKFGLDGVDRWSDPSMVVQNTTGSDHSWIVLRQASIVSKFEILIDMAYSAADYWRITGGVSFGAGFTGGTLSARPTATDEHSYVLPGWGGPSTDNIACHAHVLRATSGESTRIFFTRTGYTSGVFIYEKPLDTHPIWTNPGVSAYNAAVNNDIATWAQYVNGEGFIANFNGLSTLLMAASSGYTTNYPVLPYKITYSGLRLNAQEGTYVYTPVHVFGRTLGAKGYAGRLIDLYFGPDTVPTGSIFSCRGGYQFAKFGVFLTAWDGPRPIVGD